MDGGEVDVIFLISVGNVMKGRRTSGNMGFIDFFYFFFIRCLFFYPFILLPSCFCCHIFVFVFLFFIFKCQVEFVLTVAFWFSTLYIFFPCGLVLIQLLILIGLYCICTSDFLLFFLAIYYIPRGCQVIES